VTQEVIAEHGTVDRDDCSFAHGAFCDHGLAGYILAGLLLTHTVSQYSRAGHWYNRLPRKTHGDSTPTDWKVNAVS
jgi:hypothetical protein